MKGKRRRKYCPQDQFGRAEKADDEGAKEENV